MSTILQRVFARLTRRQTRPALHRDPAFRHATAIRVSPPRLSS